MPVFQVIYSSQPFGYDSSVLSNILMDARRRNATCAVTGALICRADVYLQLLEGAKPDVDATMARIKRDDRHLHIQTHYAGERPDRVFGAWAMLHDPADSWLWSQDEIAAGALETATSDQVRAVFETLAGSQSDA